MQNLEYNRLRNKNKNHLNTVMNITNGMVVLATISQKSRNRIIS